GADVSRDQRSVGQSSARERNGAGRGDAGPRVVVGEHRQQPLLADGLVAEPAADSFETLPRRVVQLRCEQAVRDQAGLEEPGEVGVCAVEVAGRLYVDRVRAFVAEQEKLAAEEQGGLGTADRIADQLMR